MFAHSRQELKPRVPAQAAIAPVAVQSLPTSRSHVIETKRKALATECAGRGAYRSSIGAIHAVIAAPVCYTPYFLKGNLPDGIHRPQAMAPDDERKDMDCSPVNRKKRWGNEMLSRQTTSDSCNDMRLGEETLGDFTSDSDVDSQRSFNEDSQTKIDGTSPVDSPSLLIHALDLCTGPSMRPDSFYVFGNGEIARERNSFLHFD